MKRDTPFNWRCPYCGRDTTISYENYSFESNDIGINSSKYGRVYLISESIECPNTECRELYINFILVGNAYFGVDLYDEKSVIKRWGLMPKNAKPLPSYVPEVIRKDYEEACLILNDSPKASATLARRCLQGMVRDFWDIPKNKRGNLAAELNYLSDIIDSVTLDIINTIRRVGNIGAHMEKDVNVIVDVERNEAELLIELIESLIDAWYVARHDAEVRRKKAIELVQKKEQQKQQAKKKANKDSEGEQ